MEIICEVDIRSRETGNSIETIYSGTHDEAWNVFYEWYKKHPENYAKFMEAIRKRDAKKKVVKDKLA